MKNRVAGILKYAYSRQLSLVFTAIILLLAFSQAHAAVPKDQLPVPYSQLEFWGNHRPINDWPAKKTLHSVGIEGSLMYLPNEGACSWPSPDGHVNANVHIILFHEGRWIASPWDYMGVCQEHKHYDAIGDIPYMGWKPVKGETYYFFLTTISRDPSGIGEERTNVVKYVWFGATGYPPPVEPECVGRPVINSFTATPKPIVFNPNKVFNVQLSWKISNSDGVRLVADTGESAESSPHSPVIDGLQLFLRKTTKFTLYGKNPCTPFSLRPSRTITVEVQPPGLPWLQGLILYAGADVETLAAVLDPDDGDTTMWGSVNAKNKEAEAWFQYGLDTNYGEEVSATPANITGGTTTLISAVIDPDVTPLVPGGEYHYRVKAKLRNKFSYGADKFFFADDVPMAVTVEASGVDAANGTLNGLVNPKGATTTVKFEYGLDTSYGDIVEVTPPLNGSDDHEVSTTIGPDLFPGTTYHYRVTAKNYVGSVVNGDDMTFTTDAIAPEVITLDAEVTTTGATLKAEVNTNGARTEVKFYLGLDPDPDKYLFETDSQFFDQLTSSQDVEYFQGLGSGWTWHYYATADNGVGGIIRGVTKSFTIE